MSTVKVTFSYDPDEPDDHECGMSEAEFEKLTMLVIGIGGYDMESEKDVDPARDHRLATYPKADSTQGPESSVIPPASNPD